MYGTLISIIYNL